ncbi:pyridoxal-phosphate dependent enzyme [Mesorhizobium sp. B2-4-1]|uniref:pyridoxal-phosphate dependent enzyme n=1 Tax=Mesorhizobium sp. B2-4-1 TaxID=2589948 RepID=UPI00112CD40A|nr:pyridoxal-phosphate dependent enzyme [Mesorhizobium sp. B2-4-1]TPL59380.1 pyridoxal-phosphate dependent enzyme [Mesorhizobium sp. B2-4-1]
MSNEGDIAAAAARSVRAHARIRGHIAKTPLLGASAVGDAIGSTVLFKYENFQFTNSFKARGAFSKLTAMDDATGGRPFVTASSGNHGIASSFAASRLFRKLSVVLPHNVTKAKLARIRSFGVDVILHGDESGQSEAHARRLGEEKGLVYVSPYNDPDVVAGQGTIGLELLEEHSRIDNVFIAMGGGGLIGGIGAVMKAFSPRTRIIGCAAANSMALAASMEAGKVIDVEHLPTLADGVAGGMDEDSVTLGLARSVVDNVVICSEAEFAGALARLAIEEHLLVEGAAGLAMAGLMKHPERYRGQVNAIVLCGGNFDYDELTAAIAAVRPT